MIGIWLAGLVRRRPGRLLAVTAGTAVTVAALASLAVFLTSAKQAMTAQATRRVAVDWQVAVPDPAATDRALRAVRADAGTAAAEPVGLATVPGLAASTRDAGGSVVSQQTASARVLGITAGYAGTFPGELRVLAGTVSLSGPGGPAALLAQQTASNLAARVGDVVRVRRPGLPVLAVTVAGVVDLPQADSLFQRVGAPAGSQPAAPPDNVMLLDLAEWHRAFDPMLAAHPEAVTAQVHVRRDHALPADPAAAFVAATGQARHLEAELAGTVTVGDNLAAALDAARGDALYAEVLFVFLGLPGAVLAAALTVTVAAAGAARRRRERSLLRLRGASPGQVLAVAAAEALLVGVAGAVLGLAGAALVGRAAFGAAAFGATPGAAAGWMAAAAAAGLGLAAAALLGPARRDLRHATVLAGWQQVATAARRTRGPLWARLGLDLAALLGAYAVYRVTSRAGYHLVVVPEGVPTISVSYWAFAGPALLWLGAAGLTWRLVDLLLHRGRRVVAVAVRPVAGRLAGLAAAGARRQRRMLARASVLGCLAIAFAASTAVFNSTYLAQAEVDARLTNGADVTVTEPPSAHAGPADAGRIAAVAGVRGVEPLQHRFAYVGSDLQDLYGVRPATILGAGTLQDAYFDGGTARQLIGRLANAADAILVSAETAHDYQLQPGDALTLRLRDAGTGHTIPVTFHYAGVVKEFPTAPRDSFFVANAGYVATATGDDSVGAYLVSTAGDPHPVAERIRALLGPGPRVTDLTTSRTAVGSSLTAVDLAGLTRVELGLGLLLAVAAGGLVLGLGLDERRRDLTVVAALGARASQVRALVGVDAALVTAATLLAGGMLGAVLSQVLVAVLTGVFDPPPESLATPWPYLAGVALATASGVLGGAAVVSRRAQRQVTANLRQA
ncbi:MAG TPA: ABC transporter permease [Mycobacteriales bacterium]|nr:ABC transporter permease [Mycobacteriales bacterium]